MAKNPPLLKRHAKRAYANLLLPFLVERTSRLQLGSSDLQLTRKINKEFMSFPHDVVGSPKMGPSVFTPPSSPDEKLLKSKRKAEDVVTIFQDLTMKVSPPRIRLGGPVGDIKKIKKCALSFGGVMPDLNLPQNEKKGGPAPSPDGDRHGIASFVLGDSKASKGLPTLDESDTLPNTKIAGKENFSPPTVFRFLRTQPPQENKN